MSRARADRAGARGVAALARLTMIELVRRGTAPLAFLVMALAIGLQGLPVDLEFVAARARFLDLTFSLGAIALLLAAVVAGVQLAFRHERPASGEALSRRLLGESGHCWGRMLGLVAVSAMLGLLVAFTILVNVGIRFGDIAGAESPLRRVIAAEGFANDRDTRFLRPQGDPVALRFALGARGSAPLELRFAPKLLLVGDDIEPRAAAPVSFVLKDESSGYSRRRLLGLNEGKPLRLDLDLPDRVVGPLVVEIRNESRGWLMKFDRGDAVVFAEPRSLAASILLGGLVLGLHAAFFGMLAFFLRGRIGPGNALFLALALALVSASFDLVEEGLLARGGSLFRSLAAAFMRVLLPDFARHDVAAMMVRGVAPGWNPAGELLLRLLAAGLVLGFLSRRRGA